MSTGKERAKPRIGPEGERIAREYLERSLGWRVHAVNWRCRFGELDLVASEGDWVVVVEVKTRASERFGTAEEAVDAHKRRHLRRLIECLLLTQPELRGRPVRLDVIGIYMRDGVVHRLRHVRDALDGW